jgi:hypothetical protein
VRVWRTLMAIVVCVVIWTAPRCARHDDVILGNADVASR